ncbi:sulfatase family protein [Brachyspira hyodysenteriae]|uniref:sulfatase family protein n=1 Tax=Brachyspira hyodysenteriae TaxID=159 RepID=UPI001ADDE63A|nr:sulfatase-like hydrolase/transferase [Brachyspira hyodysenteriae]MDA0079493.1 sulfatase-like hydrolase/transferase [Brachyspira hyodysenteriae]QTM07499.1 sulfatase-like hydrolase/transferase [Brachyspira hyodysenteriae]
MNSKKPNIILITADQMRADSIEYINDEVKTPVLNELAENGSVFTNSFCTSPVCTPSRASIFTGRYPMNIGAWNIGTELNEDEVTLADYLKEDNYFNVASGKMHFRPQLKNLNWEFEDVPKRDRVRERDKTYYGFDITHITEDDKQGEYLDFANSHGCNLEIGKGIDGINPIPEELHQTYWTAQKAIDEIDNFNFDKPLFMWVSFVDPHHPFDPIKKYYDIYKDIKPKELNSKLKLDKKRPEHLTKQGDRGYWPGGGEEHHYSKEEIKEIKKLYYGMISFIDSQVGRIIDKLKEKNEFDNTIIIFTSDHGEYLGDYGLLKKGPFMYDCLIKVPLLFYGKGIVKNRSDEIIENIDILPTILDMLGKEIPYGIQGHSIKNILTGEDKNKTYKKGAVITYDAHDRGIFIKTYRTKQYKLSIFLDEEYGEFYDLEKDPNEENNLFFNKEYDEIKNKLLLEMCHKMIECSDPLNRRYASW